MIDDIMSLDSDYVIDVVVNVNFTLLVLSQNPLVVIDVLVHVGTRL